MSSQNFNDDLFLEALSIETGKLIGIFTENEKNGLKGDFTEINDQAGCFKPDNPWFTPGNVLSSLESIRAGLIAGFKKYPTISNAGYQKTIAFVINPGAPFEGFGEILYAAIHGFICIVKLPADSRKAFGCLLTHLGKDENQLSQRIKLIEGSLPPFDAIIGINAFENKTAAAYISRKPNLVLSMKGCTVTLTGNESESELFSLASDICRYFGRSFYSLKSLRVPEGYRFNDLFAAMEQFNSNSNNHRYFNHYEYHKSIFLINGIQHLDNGFILLTPDPDQTGKTAVVTYSCYDDHTESGSVCNEDNRKPVDAYNSPDPVLINGMIQEDHRLFYNSAAISGFLSGL